MVTCPNCKTENRVGAKFCKSCAARLPVTTAATRPLNPKETIALVSLESRSRATAERMETRPMTNPRTDTKPLAPDKNFARRPAGAVFGDAYLQNSLIFSNERQHQYLVSQLETSESMQIRVCQKPECGAYFLPREGVPEKFCTDCGSPLAPGGDSLMLTESLSPVQTILIQIIARGLSHSSVRSPMAAFDERLGSVQRYCMVAPQTSPLESRPETAQVFKWGISLGRGLDYLHDNGVSFNGRINEACFGLAQEPAADGQVGNRRAVWANFDTCSLHRDGYVTDRKADTRALAQQIYSWATGKSKFAPDPSLMPAVLRVFEQALDGAGFTNGCAFADALEQAQAEAAGSQVVDFRLGRRTSVGMVRTLNEDSVLTLEINRILQSISQPLGLFVVADGMGGHAAGELASGTIVNAIAKKALEDLLPSPISKGAAQDRMDWLREAVEATNRTVFEMRKSAGTDMGSTMVSAVVEGNIVYIAHVGDSRAYLVNSKGIRRLTTDHSLVERLIATNQITREEARHHPQRNVIYRTIGDKQKIDVEVASHTFSVGDNLLLCSDGMSGMVDDQTMYNIVISAANPQAACDALVAAANAAGGEDNISTIIVQIVQA